MMLSALNSFACGSTSRYPLIFDPARCKADAMYDLFLDRYDLAVPIPDEEHPITDVEHHIMRFTERAESNMLLTEHSLRKILASQFTPIHDQAFESKFSVAMRSMGWPADALIGFLQPCSTLQLATAQDSKRRTALHWAAKHLGYWTSTAKIYDIHPDDTKVKSYAELATKLLNMGSNAHAVNTFHETPLMTMLRQAATFYNWAACANPVKRWGEIIIQAGLDLNAYVEIENSLLLSLAENRRGWDWGDYFPLHPAEMQLRILQNSTLAAQVKFCRPLTIWEQWVPPGAWDRDWRLPSRSIGIPLQASDDEQLYWREMKTVKIYSRLYLIKPMSQANRPFYSLEDLEENWRALFEGVQDDHGMVATTISRGRSRTQAGSPIVTARALSVPHNMTDTRYNGFPTGFYGLQIHTEHDRWMPMVYRCPFEPRWRLWGGALSDRHWWHIEMPRMLIDFESRDISERLYAADDWEVQLLREQGDHDVVKKFAQRFCPELKRLVDQELEFARLTQSSS